MGLKVRWVIYKKKKKNFKITHTLVVVDKVTVILSNKILDN